MAIILVFLNKQVRIWRNAPRNVRVLLTVRNLSEPEINDELSQYLLLNVVLEIVPWLAQS